ncbi:hypothetical protein MMC30_003066 [Trapelia coarctata]|nr:hypothetical protein [Trapelia coarctata]
MTIGSFDQDGNPPANTIPDAPAAAVQSETPVQPSPIVTTATSTTNEDDVDEPKDETRMARSETARHESPEYDPNDARTMSPRRNSAETEKLAADTRAAVQEEARLAQSGLMEIAESIEMVRSDHDKLEKHNLALQDYIGGLTRSMAKGHVSGKGKK